MLIGNIETGGLAWPVKIQYRKLQSRSLSASGIARVYSSNFEEVLITIKLPGKDELLADSIRSFIRSTANYAANIITLTPESSIDLGNGKGIPVNARYWSDNFDYVKNAKNSFDFEFTFRRENT
jgi:hypothetical protein